MSNDENSENRGSSPLARTIFTVTLNVKEIAAIVRFLKIGNFRTSTRRG